MASPRTASPMRGLSYQLSRLSLRQDAVRNPLSASFARPIATSPYSQAAVSSITTSVDGYVPVRPLEQQSVLATIHKFPSLEPLRLESFPATHLYLPTRRDILHRAVVYEGDKTRLGTASTKTRYEIRGSARKIRPQKGSGNARLGDKKSPMLRGGGVSHGPKPRDFSSGLQKKVYDLAWRTALSYRYRKGELIIVDNAIELESPSQPLLNHIFDMHDRERGRGRSLLVTTGSRPLLEQTLDKMDRRRQAVTWQEVDVKLLLELSRIIIERNALCNILQTHQTDLTHGRVRPQLHSESPSDPESVLGWTEFRALMQASPVEREAVRAEAYESAAYRRWERAKSLPEDSPEKRQLTISAYELLADAKDLRREQLPTQSALEYDFERKASRVQGIKGSKAADEAALEAGEAQVTQCSTVLEYHELLAQAAEHRRDALRWRGDEEAAQLQEHAAGDARTDVAEATVELLRAKKEHAQAKAQVCLNNGDEEGRQTWLNEMHELEIQEHLAREETDPSSEEVEGEELQRKN